MSNNNIINEYPDSIEPYQTNNWAIKANGFTEDRKSDPVIVIESQLEVTNEVDKEINLDEIKFGLINKMVRNIFDSGKVVFEKRYDRGPWSDYTTYQAKLSIANPDVQYNTYLEQTFKVRGVRFSEKQLIKAIENTFPEYLV